MFKNNQSLSIAYLKSKNITEYELDQLHIIFSDMNKIKSSNFSFTSMTIEDLVTNNENIDILLVFSDSDLLTSINKFSTFPKLILVVEMPGDNSFFAQSTLNNLKENLTGIINNEQILIDERSLLQIKIDEKSYLALNDIHLTSSIINARIRYDILVDSNTIFSGNADSANAILISTPTGSTAMSLNVGGAIIQPQSQVFQIQAIASRNLYSNHFIVSDLSLIELEIVESQGNLVINIDNSQISTNTKIFTIQKAIEKLYFLRFPKQEEITHQKLSYKISFEDTQSLTSSAKFILHILQNEDKLLTINEISDVTHITNQKTIRNAIKLLMAKGLIKRKENLHDLREHLYFATN